MRLLVLINDKALGKPRGPSRDDLQRALDTAGAKATLRVLPGGAIAAATREAIGDYFSAVAIGGGDGTVGAAAGALAGTGIPLGVLPLGTLNHFAKDLGLPADLPGAARVVNSGRHRTVDLGEVNGRIFVNNSALGFYPRAVRERQEHQHRLGKWLAMGLALLRLLWRFPRERLAVAADEARVSRPTPIFFVGNNRYETGLPPTWNRPALDRGELWVVLAPPGSRPHLLKLAAKAVLGRLEPQRDLDSFVTAAVRIDSPRPRLHVALDGEVCTLAPPLFYRTRPGALRVLAPPEATP